MEINKGLEWFLDFQKLTIPQAAFLIAGLNPGKCTLFNKIKPEESGIYEGHRLVSLDKTSNFRGAYHAIVQAGKDYRLKIEWSYDFFGNIDADSSHVFVEDLKEWLLSCGYRPAFFFPKNDSDNIKDHKYTFQNPNHPRYAPKLAAAVAAWEEVSEAAPNKSVKATLAEWVQENAEKYVKKNGELTKDFIEQVSSVANWDPTGGAPKTKASVSLSEKKTLKK
ncbi:hypothetical protein [Bartonella sp. AU55XJBT]|uniref:hypothetical protein n=1 Tax=Bartonella sp. AU55XJBT TaxID=3019091 RepID=UPI00235F7A87|nr:hypothetical protein [Bartonella sp. AU55XJBT]